MIQEYLNLFGRIGQVVFANGQSSPADRILRASLASLADHACAAALNSVLLHRHYSAYASLKPLFVCLHRR